jgi:hypothetical protein
MTQLGPEHKQKYRLGFVHALPTGAYYTDLEKVKDVYRLLLVVKDSCGGV